MGHSGTEVLYGTSIRFDRRTKKNSVVKDWVRGGAPGVSNALDVVHAIPIVANCDVLQRCNG